MSNRSPLIPAVAAGLIAGLIGSFVLNDFQRKAHATAAASLATVAVEVANATRMLTQPNVVEETRFYNGTVGTTTVAVAPTSNKAFQSYQCVTTAATAAAGIYVVSAGTAVATLTSAFGPYCTDSSQCPLGPTITADSKAVNVQAAAAAQSMRCKFGITPPPS